MITKGTKKMSAISFGAPSSRDLARLVFPPRPDPGTTIVETTRARAPHGGVQAASLPLAPAVLESRHDDDDDDASPLRG